MLAPMALEPIPASQANTMEVMGPSAFLLVAPREARAADFLPLLTSVAAMAADRSPAAPLAISRLREALKMIDATTKVTAAARTTERITPTYDPGAVCARTARKDPGAAGARRPEPKTMLVVTPVIPPRIIAISSVGFISTYGK
ncbi:hypothetical protein SDC9_206757 [bioreactor metagenome]|uniref:Uncharacterized protein n=1 Tax=bioreactor metagenome TaxID=1076179 RepID=A0A645J8L0_9ZZZZ